MSFRDTIILAMSEMRRDENISFDGWRCGVFGQNFRNFSRYAWRIWSERVRDCPISEAAISGAAAGAAMTIVDMTFMWTFPSCAMDNIVNQAAKLVTCLAVGQCLWQSAVRLVTELVLQLQHSQSIESWFTHIPSWKVVAPGTPADMKDFLSLLSVTTILLCLEYKSEFNQKGEFLLIQIYYPTWCWRNQTWRNWCNSSNIR